MPDDKDLPESQASRTGGTNGAMADTSAGDLKRGYSNADADLGREPEPFTMPTQGGFAGRPHGWER